MIKVVGVRFRTAGKIYFFDPLQFIIKRGDHVIVETARGIEYGTVVTGVTEVADEKVIQPLKPVIRLANQRDIEQEAANRQKEKEAFRICLDKIRDHGLEMKLIDAEYTFDNNKVLFYFTADGRIDFRELVKDLASVFKTRIELRQIGVRDETKIVGGIGICGRSLCCHSYLADFIPVSIKMAKEQNLSLNPAKISGVCGRLMCCLKNEEETYEELNRRLPNIGDSVTAEDGLKGKVHSVNVLRQLVKVVVDVGDEKEIKEYPVAKINFRKKQGRKEETELSREELEELERLEEEEKEEEQASAVKPEGGQRTREKGRQGGRPNGGRQAGQRFADGERNQGEQTEGERRQTGQHTAEGNRRSGQHPAEGHRQTGRYEEDTPRQPGQRTGEGRRQSGRRQRDMQRGTEEERDGDHASGRNRQENRKHHDNRNHQNNPRQENHSPQGKRPRYANRNRRDMGTGQEG
ncbi:MAG: hypothetical protein HFH91_13065 [Lachnospiraceae bacterium]|nr:hypothetical protein [Lachnospiraceae bacterium]